MEDSLIVANEIPHGYTWTLASRLGDSLLDAETFYGKRNKDFTLLGFEFCESGPRIWYPKSREFIIIQLSFDAMKFEEIALYQLAHESIHLLNPSGGEKSNFLEEGLAVYHSWYFVNKIFHIDAKVMTANQKYLSAGLLVEKVLTYRQDFFLNLRKHCKNWCEASSSDILRLCPEISLAEATILSSQFHDVTSLNSAF